MASSNFHLVFFSVFVANLPRKIRMKKIRHSFLGLSNTKIKDAHRQAEEEKNTETSRYIAMNKYSEDVADERSKIKKNATSDRHFYHLFSFYSSYQRKENEKARMRVCVCNVLAKLNKYNRHQQIVVAFTSLRHFTQMHQIDS